MHCVHLLCLNNYLIITVQILGDFGGTTKARILLSLILLLFQCFKTVIHWTSNQPAKPTIQSYTEKLENKLNKRKIYA